MQEIQELCFKRLRSTARAPERATQGSAGYDLYADIVGRLTLLPGQTVKVGTGIAIALPHSGLAALVYARSSLGVLHGVVPSNCVGVIDSDYRGEIIVALHNHGEAPYEIVPGDRIAQLVITPVFTPRLRECAQLDDTQRGAGGWGSTGR